MHRAPIGTPLHSEMGRPSLIRNALRKCSGLMSALFALAAAGNAQQGGFLPGSESLCNPIAAQYANVAGDTALATGLANGTIHVLLGTVPEGVSGFSKIDPSNGDIFIVVNLNAANSPGMIGAVAIHEMVHVTNGHATHDAGGAFSTDAAAMAFWQDECDGHSAAANAIVAMANTTIPPTPPSCETASTILNDGAWACTWALDLSNMAAPPNPSQTPSLLLLFELLAEIGCI